MPTDLDFHAVDARRHVHGQTNLRQHAEEGPTAMVVEGKGVWITTDDGRRLIDGFSGLGCTSLGYDNERIAAAAHRQLSTLPFAPTFYGRTHPKIAELADRLVGQAPGDMSRVIFQCSGSEATDTLIKFLWARNVGSGRARSAGLRLSLAWLLRQHGCRQSACPGQPHMHAKFGLPLDGIRQDRDPQLLPRPSSTGRPRRSSHSGWRTISNG